MLKIASFFLLMIIFIPLVSAQVDFTCMPCVPDNCNCSMINCSEGSFQVYNTTECEFQIIPTFEPFYNFPFNDSNVSWSPSEGDYNVKILCSDDNVSECLNLTVTTTTTTQSSGNGGSTNGGGSTGGSAGGTIPTTTTTTAITTTITTTTIPTHTTTTQLTTTTTISPPSPPIFDYSLIIIVSIVLAGLLFAIFIYYRKKQKEREAAEKEEDDFEKLKEKYDE